MKKQIEALKRELTDATLANERLRAETKRERVKWRSVDNASPILRSESSKLVHKLQSMLESERSDFKKERLRLTRELEDAKRLLHRMYKEGSEIRIE